MRNLIKKCLIMFIIGAASIISSEIISTAVGSTKAYASTEDTKVPYLRDIYLSEDDSISFAKNQFKYVVDVDEDVDEIILRPKPDDSDYRIKINDDLLSKDEKYKYTAKLNLGKNTFKIKVTDTKNNISSIYKVFIYRGGEKNVFLKDLTLNNSNFGFDQANRLYNIELDEGTKEAVFKIETIDDNHTVSVQDTVLNSNNAVKIKFKEKAGKYSFVVKVKDNDTERIGEYSISIYLGIPVTPNVQGYLNQVLKPNQWVIVNGRWQYNDALGNPIKDKWFYDSNYEGYFHFNSRGNMQTGWVIIDDYTYYLQDNGKMYIGWTKEEDKWYYLDFDGKMQTGWSFIDGKWYYFNNFGSMQTGWINLEGKWYFLAADGHMKTGWILYDKKWYYLNSDGSMKTGWLYYNNDWYYLNDEGDMKSGRWLYYNHNWYYMNYSGTMRCGWLYQDDKYYYMDEDGKMVTGTKIIDNYCYNFGKDGAVIF